MAAFEVTSPDQIAKPTNGSPASIVQVGQTLGDSVQAAFNKRERYDYVWANSSERTAQTGMVQGSRGYQSDTKTEYIYDNSNWRLSLSYIEFTTPSQVLANGHNAPTPLNLNVTNSTDTTFVNWTNPGINFVNPGVYSLSWTISASTALANDWAAFYTEATFVNFITINGFTQGGSTVVVPFYRVTAANTKLYPSVRVDTDAGTSITSTFRIGRLG